MNYVQILKQMKQQHIQVINNLDKLDYLKLKCSTQIGSDSDKKQYNKLLEETLKIFRKLEISYMMLSKQKVNFPSDFIDIGAEISHFKNELSQHSKLE